MMDGVVVGGWEAGKGGELPKVSLICLVVLGMIFPCHALFRLHCKVMTKALNMV